MKNCCKSLKIDFYQALTNYSLQNFEINRNKFIWFHSDHVKYMNWHKPELTESNGKKPQF